MQTFEELYTRLIRAAADNRPAELRYRQEKSIADKLQHPEKYAPVWHNGSCDCACEGDSPCVNSCIYQAIGKDKQGHVIIDSARCVGCAQCIEACKSGKLTGSRDILPVLYALKNPRGPVYALAAPAIAGQFGDGIKIGQLRSAFKKLGFADMVEVALFADILTLREALLFNRNIKSAEDYMITSCCCPIWVAMVRKGYGQLLSHMPDSVSPMVASGRSVKAVDPHAVTVFIGPCIAKKVEARERDISDAVDHVLTFEETRDIFDAFQMNLSEMPDDTSEQSSKSGRLYARTGGVSEAVQETVRRLDPYRRITVKARQADGVPACKELLNQLKDGLIEDNFLEGMGCPGGCVGGPKTLIGSGEGRAHVNMYGDMTQRNTPLDNPNVLELLHKLGFESIESLLNDSKLFTRRSEETVKA